MSSGYTRLVGKWAVVTGGGRGIGRAIAIALASEGGNLVLCSRTLDQLNAVAVECKVAGAGEVECHRVDMGDPLAVDAFCSAVTSTRKVIYALVNAAGSAGGGEVIDGNPDTWDSMVHVNLLGAMRITRRLVPSMVAEGEGLVVNIGSIAAIEGMRVGAGYAASKFGLRGWSLSIYEQLRFKNIKVVLINPAFVDTPMARGLTSPDKVIYDHMIKPEDVAECVMLALRTSPACVPVEITLRLTLSAYKTS